MAVKVENNKIVVSFGEHTNGEDLHDMIKALLGSIMSMDEDLIRKDEVYSIALMIEYLLPDAEAFAKMLKQ